MLDVAIENATEGCVRETYGALVAAFQARTAEDPEIRQVLTRIAREARHAGVSHDVALWLDTQLDATSRARVASERARSSSCGRRSSRRRPTCSPPSDRSARRTGACSLGPGAR